MSQFSRISITSKQKNHSLESLTPHAALQRDFLHVFMQHRRWKIQLSVFPPPQNQVWLVKMQITLKIAFLWNRCYSYCIQILGWNTKPNLIFPQETNKKKSNFQQEQAMIMKVIQYALVYSGLEACKAQWFFSWLWQNGFYQLSLPSF